MSDLIPFVLVIFAGLALAASCIFCFTRPVRVAAYARRRYARSSKFAQRPPFMTVVTKDWYPKYLRVVGVFGLRLLHGVMRLSPSSGVDEQNQETGSPELLSVWKKMRSAIAVTACMVGLHVLLLAATAQTFVYSGREYLNAGRSWAQIREFDVATNKKTQLTSTTRNHWNPWCAPDGRSVLFTADPPLQSKALYRFDRLTKQETAVVTLEEPLFDVVEAIGSSRIIVEERGGIVEVIDITKNRKIRKIAGVNPTVSSNHAFIARQTAMNSIVRSGPPSHILLSRLDVTGEVDLGEGATPVFIPGSSILLFLRFHALDQNADLVRYNVGSKSEQVQTTMPDFDTAYRLTVSPDGTAIVLSLLRKVRFCGVLETEDSSPLGTIRREPPRLGWLVEER